MRLELLVSSAGRTIRDIVGRLESAGAPCTLLEGMQSRARTRENDTIFKYTFTFICNCHSWLFWAKSCGDGLVASLRRDVS